MDVKVDIYKNKMVIVGGGSSRTIVSDIPFSSDRLLVGTFLPAVDCHKFGLKQIDAIGFLKLKPKLRISAKEMNQGGLSEVEERC